MKKISCILVAVLTLTLLLAACGGHEHAFSGTAYDYDIHSHWLRCECGEAGEKTAHETDEWGLCSVCGIGAYLNEDGTGSILVYDEWGTMTRQIEVDAEGNVTFELRYEVEYYEDGNPKSTKTYYDGVLENECTYLPSGDGMSVYTSMDVSYFDGMKYVSNYVSEGVMGVYQIFDADGNMVTEDRYEYEYDDDGNMIRRVCYTNGELSSDEVSFVGPDGCLYIERNLSYENGEVATEYAYEYEFADSGDLTYQAVTINGMLDSLEKNMICPDGQLRPVLSQMFEAGEVFYETAYEYEFADSGDLTYQCVSINGVNTEIYRYLPDADGWYYLAQETIYTEDGELVSDTHYNEFGEEIAE